MTEYDLLIRSITNGNSQDFLRNNYWKFSQGELRKMLHLLIDVLQDRKVDKDIFAEWADKCRDIFYYGLEENKK